MDASSFVQEFVSEPHDGVTLLLDLLRTIQLNQGNTTCASPGSNNTTGRIPPSVQRKALLDELSCLQCVLCCCARYSEAIRRLSSCTGLFTLAVCIMSNVNKSRIIALQLLTKACGPPGHGHSNVSEAMSTLRLRFGEPVRFRFLVGMLTSAGGQGELLAAGMKFLNVFLNTSDSTQSRLYIQAELEQAGFDMAIIKKIIPINSPFTEQVFEELDHWEKNHIDVETLSSRVGDAEKENDALRDKVLLLERRIQILQEEKGILISLEQCLKERCSELQSEVTSLKSEKSSKDKKGNSNHAEDEGISSSERSLTPDEDLQRDSSVYEMFSIQSETINVKAETKIANVVVVDDDEETTIDDVIEELKNVINDAETEMYKPTSGNGKLKKEEWDKLRTRECNISSRIQMRVDSNVVIHDPIFDNEVEIIPSNLHPQPPRRTRSLVHFFIPSEDYDYTRDKIFFENETPYTSDESSDSLLSASKCHLPRIEKDIPSSNINSNHNRAILNAIMDVRERAAFHEKQRQSSFVHRSSSRNPNPKRSESFQHIQVGNGINKKGRAARHNSVDGLYHVGRYTQHQSVMPEESRQRRPKKTQGSFAIEKQKSKSLDRIDDGLDAMVDIVVTDHKAPKPLHPAHGRPQSDSGNVTSTTLSRSISNVFSVTYSQERPEDRQKIFLPSYYYFPRVQEKQNSNQVFVRRGHQNAGLYSGNKSGSGSSKKTSTDSLLVRNKTHLSSLGKVTDSPSGLY